MPLCLLRDLSKLAFSSFLGLACEAGILFACIWRLGLGVALGFTTSAVCVGNPALASEVGDLLGLLSSMLVWSQGVLSQAFF